MKLQPDDKIVTAWAESCRGPGWNNPIIWVIVRNKIGDLREECIQPDEQTDTMQTLFKVSSAISEQMRNEVDFNGRQRPE
jgi:hypothetical protein